MFRNLLCVMLFISGACFGDRQLQLAKYDGQEELYEKGGLMLFSSKQNDILFYQTSSTLKYNKANFYFSFTNCGDKPVNINENSLTVTDQFGRRIRVVPKSELVKTKQKAHSWAMFSANLSELANTMEASKAGDTTVHTHAHGQAVTDSAKYKRGKLKTSEHTNTTYTDCSSTYIRSEAERQRALTETRQEAALRRLAINNEMNQFENKMDDNYFAAQTVYPEEAFSANLQIDVPKEIEKDLQYIYFYFNVDGEQHIFAVYAGCKK